MMMVTYLSPRRVCLADVLVDPDDLGAVEPADVIDQDLLTFRQDGVVGGVPRDPEPFGHAGDGEVLDHDALQRPPQSAA